MDDCYLNHKANVKVQLVENKSKSLSMQIYITTHSIPKLLTISYIYGDKI